MPTRRNHFVFTSLIFTLSNLITLQGDLALAKSYKDQRSKSLHFDGSEFFNPVRNEKSFWSFLKMRMGTEWASWPEWIQTEFGKINPTRVYENEMHVTHINHSTVLIQVAGKNILTDPIYSDRCSPVSWAGPKRVRQPGIEFENLPPIDFVLISHDHYDHLDLPTIDRLIKRDNPQFFVGLGVGERFETMENVHEMDWWESSRVNDRIQFHFVPVQHFSGRTLWDRNSTQWGGFVIEADGRKIYFGGDTGYADHFKKTRERFGPMDLALLPIGAYGPRDFMKYAHVDPDEAVRAHLDLEAKTSIGMHYGTFQLTSEEYDAPVKELSIAKEKYGAAADRFLTPVFGDVLKF
jgi:L-ascorbate metabolism protein UlaG (beta-lactamase superfamily)